MKGRKLLVLLAVVSCIGVLSGCGNSNEETSVQEVKEEEVLDLSATSENEIVEEEVSENASDNKVIAEDDNSQSVNSIEEADATIASEETDDKADDKTAEDDNINWDDFTVFDEVKLMYAKTDVKVRKGPDTTYDVLNILKLNDEVSVIGKSKSTPWLEIKIGDDKAFVHGDYFVDEKIDLEALAAEQQADALVASVDEAAKQSEESAVVETTPVPEQTPAPTPTPVPAKPAVAPAGVLFIGDSRTCQMQAATGGGKCQWICEYGSKYDWFSGTAVPAADAMIGNGTKVVICMGINDPENYDSYISLVNGKAIDWTGRGAKVYYVSLNPVDSPYDFKNYAMGVFNSEVPARLGNVKWIDTASALMKSGYTLEDGIHYDTATNIKIYNMILGSL